MPTADNSCHKKGADTAPKAGAVPAAPHYCPRGMGPGDSILQVWESSVALQLMETEPRHPAVPMKRKKQQRSTRGVEMESDVPPQPWLDLLFARPRWASAAGAAARSAPGCTPCCGDPPHLGLLRAAPGPGRRAPPRPQGALESPVPSPVPAGRRTRSWAGDAERGGACPLPAGSHCGQGRAPRCPARRCWQKGRRSRGLGERPKYVLLVVPAVAVLFPLRVLSGVCVEPGCGPWRTSPPDHRAAGSRVLERHFCARARSGSSPRPALPYKRGAVDVSVLFRPLCARQRDRAAAAAIAVPPRPGESTSIRHHGEAPRPAAVREELSGSCAGCAGGDVRSGRAAGLPWRGKAWRCGPGRREGRGVGPGPGPGAAAGRRLSGAPRRPAMRRCGAATGALT